MPKNNTEQIKQPSPLFDSSEALFAAINDRNDGLCYYRMAYSGLQDVGIFEDDYLIVQRTNINDENQITIWYDRKSECSIAGFAYDNFGDISIDCKHEIHRFKKRNVELKGVIVGVLRLFGAQQPQPKEAGEITVICGECKKQLTGTPNFIKSQGWEVEESKTVCLNCDLL